MANNRLHFFEIHSRIKQHILFHNNNNYLSDNDLIKCLKLAMRKRFFEASILSQARTIRDLKNELLHRLLQQVIYGQQAEAEVIIKAFPVLLFEKGCVKDYIGRKIEGSPFQLALGMIDTHMLFMMKNYIDLNDSCQKKLRSQYDEQFPEIDEEINEKCLQERTSFFENIIYGILEEKFIDGKLSEKTKNRLDNFRDYFNPKENESIKSGYFFDLKVMAEALNMYKKFDYRLNKQQRLLFLNQVYGYLQRLVSASDAQTFCHGIILAGAYKNLSRSLELDDKSSYFSFLGTPNQGLGYDFYVFCTGTMAYPESHQEIINIDFLEAYLENKYGAFLEIKEALLYPKPLEKLALQEKQKLVPEEKPRKYCGIL